ncbi:hypothetical protein C8R47DRAFT_1051961 [Mycena vitilis]|nr:hypothetical protein C8R47DRAFT_1051961 [Mycena vitilis]
MPCYRSKICCAHRVEPVAKRPRKVLTAEEKVEAKVKRAVNKTLRENRAQWESTLPRAWVEGNTPFRHWVGTHIMFKSDAKQSFSLTETEILTLPHESVPGSFKTYFSLPAVKALQQRKFAAGALLAVGVKNDYLRCVLRSQSSGGRRKKANFECIHSGDVRTYEHLYGREQGARLI